MYHIDELEDAVETGSMENKQSPTWKVGSVESLLLFKVVDTLGLYDNTGVKLNRKSANYPNRNPNHCYYDSPQQYMTHSRNRLSPELIEQWKARQSEIRQSVDVGENITVS